jgi:2-polyprenyl-6-methoxyphenol hydroxylase-like FAD-dependent oxidoreductase
VLLDLPLTGREMLGTHRADLQEVLVRELGDALRLGVACNGFRDDGRRVVVTTSDGDEVDGDVVVGADGLRSKSRAWLLGDGPPRYSGYTGWRGVTEFEDAALHARMTETWGRGARFGLVPIGRGRMYWFLSESRGEPEAPLVPARKEELAARVRGWHEPIARVLATTEEDAISGTGIYWRKPARVWGRGRVTLLGDAIHTMTPGRGVGANTALRDAALLCRNLVAARDGRLPLVEATHAYEAAMRDYGFEAVLKSREQMDGNALVHKPVVGRVALAGMRAGMRLVNHTPPLKRRVAEALLRSRDAEHV